MNLQLPCKGKLANEGGGVINFSNETPNQTYITYIQCIIRGRPSDTTANDFIFSNLNSISSSHNIIPKKL